MRGGGRPRRARSAQGGALLDRHVSAPSAFVRDRATWLGYLSIGCFAFLEAGLGPLMPFLRADLDFGYTIASLHFSAFALGFVLVGITGERVARRWGRRAAFWGGVAGMATGALGLALSPHPLLTIPATLLMGTCGGMLALAIQATLSEQHGEARAIAIAELNLAASACAVSASVAIGGLERIGLDWRIGVLAAVAGCGALGTIFRTVQIPRAVPPGVGRLGARGRLPATFWSYAAIIFLGVSAEWCLAYWGADFLERRADLPRSTAAVAMSAFFLAMLSGRFAGSRLTRRLPATTLLIAALGLATLTFPLAWLPTWAPLNIAGLFLAGLGIANVYPLAFAAALGAAPGRIDLATARITLAGGAAMLLLPFLLGIIAATVGIEIAFGLGLPLLAAALVAASLARRAPS